MPVQQPLGLYLVPFLGLSQRLSVELDPFLYSDRGVVNRQFLSLYQSDVVVLLCRASQKAVLHRSGHILLSDCPLRPVEASKVRPPTGQKEAKFGVGQPSEV